MLVSPPSQPNLEDNFLPQQTGQREGQSVILLCEATQSSQDPCPGHLMPCSALAEWTTGLESKAPQSNLPGQNPQIQKRYLRPLGILRLPLLPSI